MKTVINQKALKSLIAFLLISNFSFSQVKITEKSYFNLKNSTLDAYCPSEDGSHIGGFYYTTDEKMCPGTKTNGSKYALAKVTKEGNVLWSLCRKDSISTMKEIIKTGNKEYVVVGHNSRIVRKNRTTRTTDAWIMKFDDDGHKKWGKAMGTDGFNTYADGIIQTKNGGYVLIGHRYDHKKITKTGHANMEIIIYRLDAKGNVVWTHIDDMGPWWENSKNVIETKTGDFIICGGSTVRKDKEAKNGTAWLICLKANGEKKWSKHYGKGRNVFFCGIIESKEGGFLLVGRYMTETNIAANCGRRGMWIVKVNSKGRIQWQQFLNDKSPGLRSYAKYNSMVQLNDGSYLLGGTNLDYVQIGQAYLLRINQKGKQLWDTTMSSERCEGVRNIHKKAAGKYQITGFLYSYRPTLQFDSWSRIIEPIKLDVPKENSSEEEKDDIVAVYNKHKNMEGKKDTSVSILVKATDEFRPSFYPNPASNKININLKANYKQVNVTIRTLKGRSVLKQSQNNTDLMELKIAHLKPATYFIEIECDGNMEVFRLLKVNR